jgi:hypothetical protein
LRVLQLGFTRGGDVSLFTEVNDDINSREMDFDKFLCTVASIGSSTAFVLLQVHGGENVLTIFTNTLATQLGQHSICVL